MTWDARDEELKLRERLACIIAEKTSGVENAHPTDEDYTKADWIEHNLSRQLESEEPEQRARFQGLGNTVSVRTD